MQGDLVSNTLLPLALAFIMFSLGLGLRVQDFLRLLHQPKALIVGFICHFIILPLACFMLIKAFGLSTTFAIGFMILAACPTGSTSNLLTYLARGDVALAVSFTAIASIVTIFTLPFIVSWSFDHFLGSAKAVQTPVGYIMAQVFLLMGLPVLAGMVLRRMREAFAVRFETVATKVATVLFILIVIAAVIKNWALLRDNFTTLAPLALLLNVSMLFVGFAAAKLSRLSWPQSVTLGIETAVQNAALAMVIASIVLKDDALAVPGALYGVLMYAGGLLFAFVMRHTQSLSRVDEP